MDYEYKQIDLKYVLLVCDGNSQYINIQSTLDMSNSDISNSLKLEASVCIKKTF